MPGCGVIKSLVLHDSQFLREVFRLFGRLSACHHTVKRNRAVNGGRNLPCVEESGHPGSRGGQRYLPYDSYERFSPDFRTCGSRFNLVSICRSKTLMSVFSVRIIFCSIDMIVPSGPTFLDPRMSSFSVEANTLRR